MNIRDTRKINLVLLAKLGWFIITDKDSLWVDLVKKKYLKNATFYKFSDSYPRRSILRGKNVLRNGLDKHVINGISNFFWTDVWLPCGKLIEAVVGFILGSLAGKAAGYTVDSIAQQLSYLFKNESKLQKLSDQLELLNKARERVEPSVLAATRNGEVMYSDVDRWLDDVKGKISDQTETPLKEDEEKAKKKCLVGLCPNVKSRHQLRKKADKEANAIAELLKQKDQFNCSNSIAHLPALLMEQALECMRPDFEAFESRSGAFNGMMEALEDDHLMEASEDDKFYTIGVYGMSGVGKTTLVNEVIVQASKKKMFQEVVLVPVKQNPNLENIQNEIAEQLGLKFDVKSTNMRAARLHDRLIQKKDQKVLIILDDIWVPLNLKALGIPSRREHKGCKILITSRNHDVLKKMDSEENVAIDILTTDEAWNLFKKMVGDIVESTPELESIAKEVSQKCAGLPIAIATQSSITGHNAGILDLLKYVRGLGLFRRFDTIQDVRNKVSTLVSNFKDSSLLLSCSSTLYTNAFLFENCSHNIDTYGSDLV